MQPYLDLELAFPIQGSAVGACYGRRLKSMILPFLVNLPAITCQPPCFSGIKSGKLGPCPVTRYLEVLRGSSAGGQAGDVDGVRLTSV